jgi:anti-repressor protein
MQAQALIAIADLKVGSASVPTVNARDLHAFLCVGTEFSHWMKRRVEEFGFVQDTDFVTSFLSIDDGGDGRTQYHLTLDMGKELAMVERNKQGKVARQYFIDCERRANAAPTIDLNDPTFLRTTLLAYTEKVMALQAQIVEQAPKVEFHDKYTKAEGNKGIREVAKLLHANEREFVTFLRTNNIVYRLNGRLAPYAHQQQALRMDVKAGVGSNDHAFNQPVFTPKGVAWIAAEWAKYQAVEV